VWRDIVFPTGHKIYIAAWAYIENWTSGVICVSARDYGVFTGAVEAAANTGIVGQWQLLSTIKTVSNGGIRLLAGRPGLGIENSRFDCVTAIDLTAEFGTGNEPTKTWCDANITPFIIW
jgi:hypothetical protein